MPDLKCNCIPCSAYVLSVKIYGKRVDWTYETVFASMQGLHGIQQVSADSGAGEGFCQWCPTQCCFQTSCTLLAHARCMLLWRKTQHSAVNLLHLNFSLGNCEHPQQKPIHAKAVLVMQVKDRVFCQHQDTPALFCLVKDAVSPQLRLTPSPITLSHWHVACSR